MVRFDPEVHTKTYITELLIVMRNVEEVSKHLDTSSVSLYKWIGMLGIDLDELKKVKRQKKRTSVESWIEMAKTTPLNEVLTEMLEKDREAERQKRAENIQVYILKTKANKFYVGITSDLDRRMNQHRNNNTLRAKFELVDNFKVGNRTEGLILESEWINHFKKLGISNFKYHEKNNFI